MIGLGSILGPILDKALSFIPDPAQRAKAKAEALKKTKAAQAGKPIPETLSQVPPADQEEGVGEFDYLDKLDGAAYEKAVESLSPAQLARYQDAV